MRRTGLAAAMLTAAPALAETAPEPPAWAHLAECSAVYHAIAGAGGAAPAGDWETGDRARRAAAAFLDRAVAEAGEAGQADPEGDVASIMAYLVPRWENRVAQLASVPSNLRWIRFCGRLGREHGTLPLPD